MLIERTSEKVDIIIEKVAIRIIVYCFNLSVMLYLYSCTLCNAHRYLVWVLPSIKGYILGDYIFTLKIYNSL